MELVGIVIDDRSCAELRPQARPLADPLVTPIEAAEVMLEDSLAAYAASLPRFTGQLAPSVA